MNDEKLRKLIADFLAAWNSQDVERVASCYTEDLHYLDPNTRGPITARDDFRRYLKKLFVAWQMEWHLKEARLFDGVDGGAFLWRAAIKKPDGEKQVELHGMDLILLRDDRISRNEVYFDRSALAVFMTG